MFDNLAKGFQAAVASEYAQLLEEARRMLRANGYITVTRETLHAGWFSAGWAPRLAADLGVPWGRDDKEGVMYFGATEKGRSWKS